LTEQADDAYEFLYQADGKTEIKPPKVKGRIVTTLQKAKEVRSMVEKCITLAKTAAAQQAAADELMTDAEKDTPAWKSWREGEGWQKWSAANAPILTARRRLISILANEKAVEVLMSTIAPRFMDREGGYTRVLRLSERRLGDAGQKAILELVGKHDRSVVAATAPSFESSSAAESAAAE
jgi:large subunit ribosomal protein L17